MNLNTLLLATVLSASSVLGSERYITLTARAGTTNSVEIASGEVMKLVSMPAQFATRGNGILSVFKDGELIASRIQGHGAVQSFVVSGPARVTMSVPRPDQYPNALGFATLHIFPQPYPPSGTIVIPPGVGGGAVSLEGSTNLVSWQSATNGVYTNHPSAMFFRLDLKRIP